MLIYMFHSFVDISFRGILFLVKETITLHHFVAFRYAVKNAHNSVAFIVGAKHTCNIYHIILYIKLKLVLQSKRMLGRTMIKQMQNKSNTKVLTKTGRPVTPNRTMGVVTHKVLQSTMITHFN